MGKEPAAQSELASSEFVPLRTPPTAIFCRAKNAKDARLASLAAGIRDEAMRLNSDIQNLLDAALITSQGLHSRRDWTDYRCRG
jgi:K+-sensing histidine kinase KdpD